MIARWGCLEVPIEVYCPVDFMGFQLVENYTSTLLKYLEVNRGFELEVELRPTAEFDFYFLYYDFYFPYWFDEEQEMRRWLRMLANEARAWLNADDVRSPLIVKGPNEKWFLKVRADALFTDPRNRLIRMSTATRSTDSRLFFEIGTAKDTACSPWGKKLKRKLEKRQCGDPASDRLRILVVDFRLAETGDAGFICWPKIAARMKEVVHLLARSLCNPYDVVVPAKLGFDCGFAPAIWLTCDAAAAGSGFLEAAGLARPVQVQEIDIKAQCAEMWMSMREEA
jgi:hypothetical protein